MLIIYTNKALFYLKSFIYIYINTICFNQKAFIKTAQAVLLSHTLKGFILNVVLNVVFLYITNKSDKVTFFFNYYRYRNPILYNDS